MRWKDYQPKPEETLEEKSRHILRKYAKNIYAEYCYMVLIKDLDYSCRYSVRQGFRKIEFNTAVETMAFLDRAITYDEQVNGN